MKKSTFGRRMTALSMTAVMLLSTVPAVAAFSDTDGHWAEKTLAEWQDQKRINGYSDGGFHPDASVTRAEFAKMINHTLNFTAEGDIPFSDVSKADWFYAEVAKAAAAGYAQGSDGAFRPEQAITRAEAAVMIARAAKLTANEKRADAFADASSIPAWAKGSAGAAAESGCMSGYPDGTFGADSFITRAEAVVTLDRVLKNKQNETIEKAGTTLENETVAGDLIIAESVGEGNVTLKNVTIKGNLIVKGGGANSIYLENTKIGGSVHLQKENVHLRLMGDMVVGDVEIAAPCRITKDSSFKGTLGTVTINLEKASSREVQIEAPAKRVELVSKVNVALNANAEKLVLGKAAEGAQLEIKRGVTVGELTADAKVKLTGSGTVASLDVSASGVTVSGSLTVKKTETTGGAKAPTVSGSTSSGGSSGGSSTPVKTITGVAEVSNVTVDYGTSEADAMSKLPGTVTLNVTENGKQGTVSAEVSWTLDKTYDAQPLTETIYTATGAVSIPEGYTYNGTLTVTATLTVKPDPDTTIASISEVTGLELPYGATIGDAILPAEVTVENGSGDEKTAEVSWSLNGTWASPGVNAFTGTVIMPDGYTYNGAATATISTTVTVLEDSAAPKTKKVVGYVDPGATTIAYAGSEALVLENARAHLPTKVMLKCEDGSYITVTVSADDWKFTYSGFNPSPATAQTVSLTQDAVLPAGYSGQTTVHCGVKVLALDTTKLDAALTAAKALKAKLVYSEAEAMTGDKIYVAGGASLSVSPADVTKDVKFVNEANRYANDLILEIEYANNAKVTEFASQQACDKKTAELQAVIDAFNAAIQTGTSTSTDAYILQAVKDGNVINPQHGDFAYSSHMQPLRNSYTYYLYKGPWSLPDSNVTVTIDWSVSGDGAQYIEFGNGRDHEGNYYSYGAKVKQQPESPVNVTFTATITRTDTNKVVGNVEYPATIGVPISLSTAQPAAPKFASGNNAEGTIEINLNGAAAITSVDASKVGIEGVIDPQHYFQLSSVGIKGGEKVGEGLSLSVSMASGKLANAYPLGNDPDQAKHETSRVTITIPKEALTLDESSGWYFPDTNLTQTVDIWLCYPQMSVNTQMTDGDKTYRNIDVTTRYTGNESVWVAYTKSGQTPNENNPYGDSNVWVVVQIPFAQATLNADGTVTYSAKDVEGFDKPGTYYIWCRAWDGTNGEWMNTNSSFPVGGQATP